MKLLLVDDNSENLYFLHSLFNGSGYNVKLAQNGVEAIELSNKDNYDLIISDIMMPLMDGFKLCHKIKSDPKTKNIPFIVYTATYTDADDEKLALKMGADLFLRKPIEPELLLKKVENILNNYKKEKIQKKESLDKIEEDVFKLYSERLINKLEKKMLALEEENKKRLQAETKLRRLVQAIKSINECIIICDSYDKIIFINEAFSKNYGYYENEILGKLVSIIDSPHNSPDLLDSIKSKNLKYNWQGEILQLRKDGTDFPAFLSISVIPENNNTSRTLIRVSRKISKKKE